MTLFDAFERIYLINLPERRDRLAAALAQLRRAGLGADDPRLRIFAARRMADAGGFPSIGAHGCYLSHLAVLAEALREGHASVLVLEDDIGLLPPCAALPAPLAAPLRQANWDLVYPGHSLTLAAPDGPHWRASAAPLVGAHCYGVHRRVLASLHAYLAACLLRAPGDPQGGPMHVDGAYAMFRQSHPGVRSLLAAPALAFQRSSRSDIHANRWFDRTPGVRALVACLRRVRNWRRGRQPGAA
jgi:glycosyl transferase family 25